MFTTGEQIVNKQQLLVSVPSDFWPIFLVALDSNSNAMGEKGKWLGSTLGSTNSV